jgi:hypothetical protein
MIRNFLLTPNVAGRLMLALLFVAGIVYAGAFDGFIVEVDASSCCGGAETEHFSSSNCNDEVTCSKKSRSGHNKPRHCSLSNGKQCSSKCSDSRKCTVKGCNGWKG